MSKLLVVDLASLRRRWLLVCVALLLLNVLLTVLVWQIVTGRHNACVQQVLQNNDRHQSELTQSADREGRLLELELDNQRLRRAQLTATVTARKLRTELQFLQEKLYSKDQELRFYQSITSNTKGASGLLLHGLHIEPEDGEDRYLCKIFLTHLVKSAKLAKGSLELRIEGERAGVPAWLENSELLPGDEAAVNYEFRDFLSWEGHLLLPEGFQPRRIQVKLTPEGRGREPLEEFFDWPLESPTFAEDEESPDV